MASPNGQQLGPSADGHGGNRVDLSPGRLGAEPRKDATGGQVAAPVGEYVADFSGLTVAAMPNGPPDGGGPLGRGTWTDRRTDHRFSRTDRQEDEPNQRLAQDVDLYVIKLVPLALSGGPRDGESRRRRRGNAAGPGRSDGVRGGSGNRFSGRCRPVKQSGQFAFLRRSPISCGPDRSLADMCPVICRRDPHPRPKPRWRVPFTGRSTAISRVC